MSITTRDLIIAGIGVAAGFVLSRYLAWRKVETAIRLQEKADDEEFWHYIEQRDAILAKYDPRSEWNEGTSLPAQYKVEIQQLRVAHREMLKRRNDIDVSEPY